LQEPSDYFPLADFPLTSPYWFNDKNSLSKHK
jgi:hypothetical protein